MKLARGLVLYQTEDFDPGPRHANPRRWHLNKASSRPQSLLSRLKRLTWAHALYRRFALSRLRASLVRGLLAGLRRTGHIDVAARADLERGGDGIESFGYGSAEVVVYEAARPHPPQSRIPSELRAGTFDFVEPMVFEIANAQLVGSTPVGFDARGRVLLETTPPVFESGHEDVHLHLPLVPLLERQLPTSPRVHLDVAALITNSWTNNYWHWLIDTLTRLQGLEAYATRTGVQPKLVLPEGLRPWQVDSLSAAGHDSAEQIAWSMRRAGVRRLVIPSFHRQYDGRAYHRPVSFAACTWLRDRVLARTAVSDGTHGQFATRVYVSRGDAAFRRVVNEDEVIHNLEGLGFVAYTLSDMSFSEQVTLFANAAVVVAPHGAGLANLIFADGPTVIELFSPHVIPLNANLARGLGFPYGYLCGKYPRGALRGRDGHMVIDVKHLRDLVARMGRA